MATNIFRSRPLRVCLVATCPTKVGPIFVSGLDAATVILGREEAKVEVEVGEKRAVGCEAGAKNGCAGFELAPEVRGYD